MKPRLILGAAIGECARVANVVHFLDLAQTRGFTTVFLGPFVPVPDLLEAVQHYDPQWIVVHCGADPAAGWRVLQELQTAARGETHRTWLFQGTAATAATAQATGLFAACFAENAAPPDLLTAMVGGPPGFDADAPPPQTLIERIAWKAPYPLIRHHYGEPTVAETAAGVQQIAMARCLDVISLRIDQNAQEHFFRPWEMDVRRHGADGVPVRTRTELEQIYAQTRTGNFPLMRCYSGTRDRVFWAMLQYETLHTAWLATPLFWYSRLDGRSQVSLRQSISDAQTVMQWHAQRGVPVEMNESHHWSRRQAPDVVAVVSAYLAAYNARACGVREYVQQLMFHNPPDTSPTMDVAKLLATLELVESLADGRFRVWRQTQEGNGGNPCRTAAGLMDSIKLQMQFRPHIVQVGDPTATDHAVPADAVITACHLAQQAAARALQDGRDWTGRSEVQVRKAELLDEAQILLQAIRSLARPGVADAFTDPDTLAWAVEVGLLDAPNLRPHHGTVGGRAAGGTLVTRMLGGACIAVDPSTGRPLPEAERVLRIRPTRARRRPRAGTEVTS